VIRYDCSEAGTLAPCFAANRRTGLGLVSSLWQQPCRVPKRGAGCVYENNICFDQER
jgi:hypothetical protein